jgi:hypothetical protein
MKLFLATFPGPDVSGTAVIIAEDKTKALAKLKEALEAEDSGDQLKACAKKCKEEHLEEIDLETTRCIVTDGGFYH